MSTYLDCNYNFLNNNSLHYLDKIFILQQTPSVYNYPKFNQKVKNITFKKLNNGKYLKSILMSHQLEYDAIHVHIQFTIVCNSNI